MGAFALHFGVNLPNRPAGRCRGRNRLNLAHLLAELGRPRQIWYLAPAALETLDSRP